MPTRTLLAALLAPALLALPLAAQAAPRHHHAARVSTATYHPSVHKPAHNLRAHRHVTHTRLAAAQARHHVLSRGS